MPLTEDELHRYITQSAGLALSDASIARVCKACAIADDALQALAAQSLFDSEPEHLHTVLEALADDDSL